MSVDSLPTLSELPESYAALTSGLTVKGRWAPLYAEPIAGSGERLTTSILAQDEESNVLVERVIRPEVLRALYGGKARAFSEMIATVEHVLGKSLRARNDSPLIPLSGFSLGNFRRAIGADLVGLVEQGRLMTASLGRTRIGGDEAESEDESQKAERWVARIRDVVLNTAEDLRPYFNQASSAIDGRAAPKLGFYNGRYAAQFGVVRRDNPGASVYHLKPRLWELVSIRPDLAGNVRERDLILHRPRLSVATMPITQRDRIRDVIDELTSVADRHAIYVFSTDRAQDAGHRVTSQARRLAA